MRAIFLILSLLLFLSCNKAERDNLIKTDYVETQVYITEAYEAKYSRVEGYIIYNGVRYYIDNGTSGYYHKEYSLKPGDSIFVGVEFQYEYHDGGVLITPKDLNVMKYEIN